MRRAYRNLEDHIVSLFNNFTGSIIWNNRSYNCVRACKPYPQRGGGECKTDVYVLLSNSHSQENAEIKISIKKDDAEFLANKLTAVVAEDLLGKDWESILIESIYLIKDRFLDRINDLAFLKGRGDEVDANFTLGWKLEVANKARTLSTPLHLSNDEIVRIIFKGENQVEEKRNAIIFDNNIRVNSGVAEYLLNGNIDRYTNPQDVINDLINLDNYDAGEIHLIFTANNFRYRANKADGARTLAVAVEWSVQNNRLSPRIIFDRPLIYQGERDMMPTIKQSLIQLGINQYSDINIEQIKPI